MIFGLVTLIFFNSACTVDFEEINTDPSLITEDKITPDLLFTNVLKNTIFPIHSNDRFEEMAGYYQNPSSSDLQARNFSNPFMTTYRNELLNISEAIRLTEENPLMQNQHAMARIWKVWIFHRLTDTYGPIPYFDAVQAVDEAVNLPKYDSVEDIYKDMLNELKEASDELSENSNLFSYSTADLLYEGDIAKWKRFSNSLRLRLAIRVRMVDPQLAGLHIDEVISAPLIDNNEYNASLLTLGEATAITGNRNPLYNRSFGDPIPMYATVVVSEELKKRNDPRLEIYFDPAPDPQDGDQWRGLPLGLDQETAPDDWTIEGRYGQEFVARLGGRFLQAEYNIMVMSAAEVFMLKAEAALAQLTSGDSQDLLHQGISQSMEYNGVDSADIDAYLGSGIANLNGTEEEMFEEIIVQKWIANFYQARESWTEYRRTGYPVRWIGNEDGAIDFIYKRLTYPEDEYFKNEKNVLEAASTLSDGDSYSSRLWWDVKPGIPFVHPRQGMFPPEIN